MPGKQLLMAGSFPDEWWMRDLAGKVFAIVGYYNYPPTWEGALFLTGYTWRMLETHGWTFETHMDHERGRRTQKFVTRDIGTFSFTLAREWFVLRWTCWGDDDKEYPLTDRLIPTGNLYAHPRGGLHHAAHVEPTYNVVGIYSR